jgi:cell division protein FtsB
MKWVAAALTITLCWMQYRLWFAEGSLREQSELEQRLQALEQQNAVLERDNAKLLEEIVALKTSNDLIEERAREDLGLIKRGETLYLFPDADDAVPAGPQSLPIKPVKPEDTSGG